VLLWFIAAVIFGLAGGIPLLDEQPDLIGLRSLLIAIIVLIPLGGYVLWSGWPLQAFFGKQPDSVALALSIPAAGAVWFIAWWLMLWLQNDVVAEASTPPEIYVLGNWEAYWEVLILTDVVLLPLVLGGLVWGALQFALQGVQRVVGSVLIGVVFGVVGMLLVQVGGVGAIGFVGYALAGIVGAYLSLVAQSPWPGVLLQGSFAYFNFRFYDNILRQAGIITDEGIGPADSFFTTEWLGGLVLATFALLITIQITRVRYGLGLDTGDTANDRLSKRRRPRSVKNQTASLSELVAQQRFWVALGVLILSIGFSFWRML